MELNNAAWRKYDAYIKEVGAYMMGETIVMTEPEVRFATVGAVYSDGVTLIFDGQEAATEKHYKCNTAILFHAGDRVKIASDSGTYVVEYIVGSPGADAPIPKGGSSGQVLAKKSSTDGDVMWKNITQSTTGKLPAGGTTGQYLKKSSATDYEAEWATLGGTLPTGGTAGQYLKKSSAANYAVEWASTPTTTTDKLTGSGTSNSATLNSSRQLVPAASSSLYAHSIGSSVSPWYNIYIGGGTMSFGTSSSKLAFFGGTAQSKLTMSTSSANMGYSSATASNYLTILNNVVGILKKYGLIG
nr:MAG TPA: hypothetical protein [Caudoviricetes sp.]